MRFLGLFFCKDCFCKKEESGVCKKFFIRRGNEANVYGNDRVNSSIDSVYVSARGLVTVSPSFPFCKKRLLQK